MICPNCSNEINFHYQVKVKTNDGVEKLFQCPKCEGYFKETFPVSFWWNLTPQIPLLSLIFIDNSIFVDNKLLKISIIGLQTIIVVPILLLRDKKKKSIIKEKGEWTAVKATKDWVVVKTTNTTLK